MKTISSIALLTLFNVAFSQQYQDVTESIKNEIVYDGNYMGSIQHPTSPYGVDLVGGALENNGTVHITFDITSIVKANSAKISLQSEYSVGIFHPFFYSVQNIFAKIPQANYLRMYFAIFSDKRNEYAYTTSVDKVIVVMLGLSKEKAQKLNWDYILKSVRFSIKDKDLDYFEEYHFDKEYFTF
jgi:hypothetical protein